jgi:hypothetical protein
MWVLELSYDLLYEILLLGATWAAPKYLLLVLLDSINDFGWDIFGQECLHSNKDVTCSSCSIS